MGSLAYRKTLAVIRRDNLDIFYSRDTLTVHRMLGYAKELVSRSREAGKSFILPAITVWPVGGEVGVGVAIQMLDKSLSNGSNGRNYPQFNTVRQL